LRALPRVTVKDAQDFLRELRRMLLDAELGEDAVCAVMHKIVDRSAGSPMQGRAFADLVEKSLAATPGVRDARGQAADRVPRFDDAQDLLWDLKELTNRTPGRPPLRAAWPAPVLER